MVLTSNQPSFSQESESLQLGDFFRAVADQAVDQRYVRAVVVALNAVGQRDIFGHEDVGFEAGGGAVGG